MNTVMDLMENHRSIRRFTPQAVPAELLRRILSAARHASTSNFIQACTVIEVTDAGKRQQIADMAGPQPWVAQSPVFLVFCADLRRCRLACDKKAVAMAPGTVERFIIATVDVALVAQNTLLAAEDRGLGGVFIGGIRNDPQLVCDLLAIPHRVYPVFGMCLGYPDEMPERKPRMPLDLVFFRDRYGTPEEEELLERYDRRCRQYYDARSRGSRQESWSRQIAGMMSRPLRLHMRAFLEARGFALD